MKMTMTSGQVEVSGTCSACGTLNTATVTCQGVPGAPGRIATNAVCGVKSCRKPVVLVAKFASWPVV